MKPSERIKDIADGYFVNYPEAIMFFLDEQAELLETHTVKEEECDCNGMHEGNCPDPRFERKEEPIEHECHKEECCENLCHCDDDAIGHFIGVEGCHKEGVKEEPATPKKKCCDNCYLILDSYPSIDSCENMNCQCHQEKLQTYFYKVTCGRCEKSIKLKHSCGRV
jgi:hypothetical protein